jgi:uncharacterized protein (DUF2249 family)/hemerythrin-like domain-containing protein
MMSRPIAGRRSSPPGIDDRTAQEEHWVGRRRLADEHAVLLEEVRRRAGSVRAALRAERWPAGEIDRLVAYLRYEVLDQTVTAERLLFPLVVDGLENIRIHGLVVDHVRLRELTDRLAATADGEGGKRDPRALVDLLDDLEEFLARHMRTEQDVLATVTSDGVESRRQPFRCHLWFPITEGPEIDLDALPREFAHRAALERFSRLRPGEHLLLRSSHDLDGLWNLLTFARPGEFGWAYRDEGPDLWRVEVTRRSHD